MYYRIIMIIIWVLILLLVGCGNDYKTTKEIDTDKIKSWQDRHAIVTQALSDPIDIEWSSKAETNNLVRSILQNNQKVTWTEEDESHFQTFQETIDRGYKGDCEDISFYWYEMIRRVEIVPDVGLFIRWVKRSNDEGHTVLVIDHFDGEIIIDNGKMKNSIEYEKILYEYDAWSIYSN